MALMIHNALWTLVLLYVIMKVLKFYFWVKEQPPVAKAKPQELSSHQRFVIDELDRMKSGRPHNDPY